MKTPNLLDKAFALKKTFLFADINLDNLLAIADKLDLMPLEPKTLIFKKNQRAFYLYIVIGGEIELLNTENRLVLKSGDVFGQEALFKDERNPFEAKALTKGYLLLVTKKHLTAIIGECPSVALHLLESFAKQISLHALPCLEKPKVF